MTIVPENNFIKALVEKKEIEIVHRLEENKYFECFIAYNKKSYMNNAKKYFGKILNLKFRKMRIKYIIHSYKQKIH